MIETQQTRFVHLRGVRYAWREIHPEPALKPAQENAPLLFLHGFTGSKANWQSVMQGITGRHLIALDLLGHGETEFPDSPTRYAISEAAEDLFAFCEELALPKVDLCGYSMGGRLALYFALAHPERIRRLILESASPGLADLAERQSRRQSDEALADRIIHSGLPAFVDYWERLPLFASQANLRPETRQYLRALRLQNNPSGLANSLRGMGAGAQPSLWPRLAELTMPVLLLAGELDQKFTGINCQMAAAIPASRLVIMPGAGHTIHLERQPDFCEQITRKF